MCSRLCARYVQLCSPGCANLSIILTYLYQLMSGASKVTPHVTGAAALLLSKWASFCCVQSNAYFFKALVASCWHACKQD